MKWPKRKYIGGTGWRKRVLYFVLELVEHDDATEIGWPWRLLFYALFPITAVRRELAWRDRMRRIKEREPCATCQHIGERRCWFCKHEPESGSVSDHYEAAPKGPVSTERAVNKS